jgi:hypothetical protein
MVLALLAGCSSGQSGAPTPLDTGTFRMALTATTNGHTYRLRQATFQITGPTSTVLDTEAQPDTAALTATLNTGSYSVLLGGPWFLERLDPASLFVADSANGAVREIDLATAAVTTVVGGPGRTGVLPGPLPARLNRPSSVTVLPGGALAITDESSLLIARF